MNRREFFQFTGIGVAVIADIATSTKLLTMEYLVNNSIPIQKYWDYDFNLHAYQVPLLETLSMPRMKYGNASTDRA